MVICIQHALHLPCTTLDKNFAWPTTGRPLLWPILALITSWRITDHIPSNYRVDPVWPIRTLLPMQHRVHVKYPLQTRCGDQQTYSATRKYSSFGIQKKMGSFLNQYILIQFSLIILFSECSLVIKPLNSWSPISHRRSTTAVCSVF